MSLTKAERDELCCVYAGLLLFDDKVDITADKLNKVITASGNTVDAYYPEFFAKYLSSIDLNAVLSSVGSGPATGAAAETSAPVQEEKKDDKGKNYKINFLF
jgi:large subunit ribosomal protein LP1